MNMSTTENKHNNIEPEIDELTKDKILGGHEYDGIRELDNKLPRWWVYLFIVTILFSITYLVGYHFLHWPLQDEEYANSMKEAPKKAVTDVVADDLYVIATDEASLADGKATYSSICATCHAAQGQGLVGPNMTDSYWIHGNNMKMLFNIVMNGAPDKSKGMIAYKDQLGPQKIKNVLSYIFTLQGTDVSAAVPPAKAKEGTYEWNPKEMPQGVVADSAATASADSAK